jgi:autotransporter-associated beta strand protein
LSGLTFYTNAGAFVLGGNSVNLSGNIVNNSPATQTINLPLVLVGSSQTVNAASGNIVISGPISESGGSSSLTKTGAGKVILSSMNTYTGGTAVLGGTLVATCSGAVPSGGSLTVGAGGVFVFDPSAAAATIAGPAASAMVAPVTATAGAVLDSVAGDSPAALATVDETQARPAAAVGISSGSSIATMPLAPRHLAAMAATSTGRSDAAVAHDTVIVRRYAGDSAAAEAWWNVLNSRGQDNKKPAAIQALDALWAAYYPGAKVGQAFQPDETGMSGWKA